MMKMEKSIIKTEDAPTPVGPYSQAVKVGNLLFVSGQGPINPKTRKKVSGGIREQTRQVLENINNILKAAGLSLENIVKVTVFIRDIKDFSEMNEVYKEYFKSNPPARTTVQAVPPGDIAIEIDAIAYAPNKLEERGT
jgi:2-iminobutanoate/2-iminopropanoate deaminase